MKRPVAKYPPGENVEWSAGYSDFFHGRPKTDCPYGSEVPGHALRWRNGWEVAERDSEKPD